VVLLLRHVDEPTQVALLEARLWSEPGIAPVTVARSAAGKVFASTSGGWLSGELSKEERFGISKPSLRYVPLSEIRLESRDAKIGGALLFNEAGQLTGMLNATLEPVSMRGILNRALQAQPGNSTNKQFGPAGMTVGYSLGIDVLQRVVQGYLSPARKPEHPTIGLFFRDSAENGAVIEAVLAGSSSEKAGLREGDVVLTMNGKPVEGAVDFAAMLFRQRVGSTVQLSVRRGPSEVRFAVLVERLADRAVGERKVSNMVFERLHTVELVDRGLEHDVEFGAGGQVAQALP